jgi:hypothetical protein
VGSGEQITPAPGFEAVTLEDPVSGRVYVAYRDPTDAEGRWPAAELIESINGLVGQFAAMPTATEEQKSARDDMGRQISRSVEDLEIMRGLYNVFGQTF